MQTIINEFLELCKDESPEAIQASLNFQASFEVWKELIEKYPERCLDIAQNRVIPSEVYFLLADSNDLYVRLVIAEKRRLPVDLFEKLAKDKSERVRLTIVGNQKTPTSVLEILKDDISEDVANIAKHNLNNRYLKNQLKLSKINEFLALCKDKSPEAIQASLNFETSFEVWKELIEKYPERCFIFAQNRTIPNEIYFLLADSNDSDVKSVIAEKRRLPVDLFEKLAKDKDQYVRRTIAANKKTPIEVLEFLKNDVNEEVSDIAKYNLNEKYLKNLKKSNLN